MTMSMKSLENEQRIITLFKEAKTVIYNGKIYQIVIAEKPQYCKGEGKTDIYLKIINNEDEQEVKITTKMTTAEFLENKVKPERAKVIFGENWANIITNYALSIKDRFESCILYDEDVDKCTAGWRIDITRGKRKLSKRIEATKKFKQEILFGTNLSEEKRHVKVADKFIYNAGVANYILLNSEQYTTAQEIIDAMQTIDEIELECYIAFCAVNYYFNKKHKGESGRSLAVYVDWSDGDPIIVYDSPLTYTSTNIFNKIKELS